VESSLLGLTPMACLACPPIIHPRSIWAGPSHTNYQKKKKKKKKKKLGWKDGLSGSSSGPEFNSQQPHGGSQPSIRRSDALFWYVWRLTVYSQSISLKKKKKERKKITGTCLQAHLTQVFSAEVPSFQMAHLWRAKKNYSPTESLSIWHTQPNLFNYNLILKSQVNRQIN